MRSQSNSPVVTFFMLAPLLAIPLLAVFGVPNLQTSKSISAAIDDDIELGDATVSTPSSEMDEPFKPIEMDHAFSNEDEHHDHHAKTIPAVHHPEALQGWSVEEAASSHNQNGKRRSLMGSSTGRDSSRRDIGGRFESVERDDLSTDLAKTSIAKVRSNSFLALSDEKPSDEERNGHKQVASSDAETSHNPFLGNKETTSFEKNNRKNRTSPALPTTWKAAVARLNELGITDFNLQPGAKNNEFYFNCSFTPKDNPRITHRFEAEASDPLKAVQSAILQVEEWQRTR